MQGGLALALALTILSPAVPPDPAAGPPALPARNQLWRFYDPVLVERVDPKYPRRALRERAEGLVVLQGIIHIDGTVSDLVVLQSDSPGHGFEKAAIDAVRQWKYAAAVENRPVDVYSTIVMEFRLDDPAPPSSD